jgi:UDP-N-acetylmuramate--alanine ligase
MVKFGKLRRLHFVGIGGIGMSGMAEMLFNLGYQISGSDLAASEVTDHLERIGIKIFYEHKAENVGNSNLVIYSAAVPMNNPELEFARQNKIIIVRRAEMLAELMRMKYSIGIAGTHGKTTTTSLIGQVMTDAGLDPTVIVGGRVIQFETNIKLGHSDYLVAEADEYDRSFLRMAPTDAVLTTLEEDHLDCYKDIEDLKRAFLEFANKVPFFGTVYVNMDDHNLVQLIPEIKHPVVTFGMASQADYQIANMSFEGHNSSYDVKTKQMELGRVTIRLPGLFNIMNSLAAIAVCMEHEIPFETIAASLANFRGVNRRFEIIGEVGGYMVIDDYAHHPTEVEVTLRAAKRGYNRPIIAIFQPHLFSRTRDFYREFAKALLSADIMIVAKIYPAREEPIEGVSGHLIVEAAKSFGHQNCHYVEDLSLIPEFVGDHLIDKALIMTIGAGSIYRTAPKIVEALKK